MILDFFPTPPRMPVPAVWTTGFSDDARFIDEAAHEGLRQFHRADSLDDGRRAVQAAIRDQLRACGRPGWDGYRAEPVRPETGEYAHQFIDALPYGLPMPTVGAETDGHLTVEWYRTPSRVLSVSISPERELHYAALLGTARRNGTEPFLGAVPEDVLELVRRVMLA